MTYTCLKLIHSFPLLYFHSVIFIITLYTQRAYMNKVIALPTLLPYVIPISSLFLYFNCADFISSTRYIPYNLNIFSQIIPLLKILSNCLTSCQYTTFWRIQLLSIFQISSPNVTVYIRLSCVDFLT